MKEFTCKKCGSNDLVKEDGLYVCQHCGTKYKPDKKDPLFSFSFTVSEGDGDTDETEEKVHIGAYVAQVINVLWVALKEFIKECFNFFLKCLLCLLNYFECLFNILLLFKRTVRHKKCELGFS